MEGQRSQTLLQGFREAMDICGLIDIGFQGRPWTYEKKVVGGLSREFISTKLWVQLNGVNNFPLVLPKHLTVTPSNHSPILLKLDPSATSQRPKKQFRYEVMWYTHADMK